MRLFKMLLLAIVLASLPPMPGTARAAVQDEPALLVYAAASLTNVLQELGGAYQQQSGQGVKFSFASSGTLARQIEAGANADVFFSADLEWMDYLQNKNLLNTATRLNLLGNRLVLVAPADSRQQLRIAPRFALAEALGGGRLAIADPASVPAGKYARAALTALGVWESVADKIVLGDSVRTALTFVDRGEAPLGIVYETDALLDKQVRVLDHFSADSHAPIVYPLAAVAGADGRAAKFIAFLRNRDSAALFKKYGFTVLQ